MSPRSDSKRSGSVVKQGRVGIPRHKLTRGIKLSVDHGTDSAYLILHDRPVAKSTELSPRRILDLDSKGRVVGIEFLSTKMGVDVTGLAEVDPNQVKQILRAAKIRVNGGHRHIGEQTSDC